MADQQALPDFDGCGGLVPAITQDADSGDVLMLAWMNRQAFDETVATSRAVYYSRSRQQLWRKGETSGHVQHVQSISVDCDGDTILLRVRQEGAACHEGYRSCFFRRYRDGQWLVDQPKVFDPREKYPPASERKAIPQTMSPDNKITELSLLLPPAPKAIGVYKTIVVVENMAYLSGHGPLQPDGSFSVGCLGADLDVGEGYEAARCTGLAMLATLRSQLGTLDRVQRLVKVLGMVRCTPDFFHQPAVINGCSELFAEVFGEDGGIAARTAVGVASLPGGWPVEIEAIFQLSD